MLLPGRCSGGLFSPPAPGVSRLWPHTRNGNGGAMTARYARVDRMPEVGCQETLESRQRREGEGGRSPGRRSSRGEGKDFTLLTAKWFPERGARPHRSVCRAAETIDRHAAEDDDRHAAGTIDRRVAALPARGLRGLRGGLELLGLGVMPPPTPRSRSLRRRPVSYLRPLPWRTRSSEGLDGHRLTVDRRTSAAPGRSRCARLLAPERPGSRTPSARQLRRVCWPSRPTAGAPSRS